MRKLKFFISLLKERDWLEEMAAQGWILTNMTCGVLYHFRQAKPCEKVFEIERFAITAHPTVADLTARTCAFDITSQFGWEQITHDEDMNYYFMKDRAGDETDEFYDDVESRRERAERYRKHLSIEMPLSFLRDLLMASFLYIILFFVMDERSSLQHTLMWFYIILAVIEVGVIYCCMVWGQRIYAELCMSRQEWEQHKQYNEKKRFKKVQQLRSYLQEKSEFGLSLKGHENGFFLFEEDSRRYNYFIDTKRCLKKRLKEDGLHFKDEKKDLKTQSLKWYEMSIANAARYDLKPVAVIGKTALVYKRPYSEKPLPWENGNENITFSTPSMVAAIFMGCCAGIGFALGFIAAIIL